jgi:hypothetical protein
MKKLIIILILCVSAQTINAKPMWEVSSNWVCNLEFSTNMLVDNNTYYGEQLEKYRKNFPDDADKINSPFFHINKHEPWTYFLDFEKSIKTGKEGNTSVIVDKFYYESKSFGNQNIIVTTNKDEKHKWFGISIVDERKNYPTYEIEFWARTSNGPRDIGDEGLLKTKTFKCNPVK